MKMNAIRTCPFCGKTTIIEVDSEQYEKYTEGMTVQQAFPTMTPTDREILITGMCPSCQEKVFGE